MTLDEARRRWAQRPEAPILSKSPTNKYQDIFDWAYVLSEGRVTLGDLRDRNRLWFIDPSLPQPVGHAMRR